MSTAVPIVNCQLVIQFRGDSLADYDAMVALEDELREELRDSATVDGHDVGSGETNIFILTSDPLRTFSLARVVLERGGRLQKATVAYREITGQRYTVVWPEHSATAFRIA